MVEYSDIPRSSRVQVSSAIAEYDDFNSERKKQSRKVAAQKTAYVFTQNIAGFIDYFGVKHCGFLTLTFSDDVFEVQEASRRFNSFRTNFLAKHFRAYIGVYERTKRGVIHFHFLVACKDDIATGFDHDAIKRNIYNSKTRNSYIASLWKLLRDNLANYGFGEQHNLVPVKTRDGISKYLAKYIVKGLDGRERIDKGFRFTRSSQDKGMNWKRANYNFSWVSEGSRHWRKSLGFWVKRKSNVLSAMFFNKTGFSIGISDDNYSAVLKIIFGAKWCYKNRDNILNFFNSSMEIQNDTNASFKAT